MWLCICLHVAMNMSIHRVVCVCVKCFMPLGILAVTIRVLQGSFSLNRKTFGSTKSYRKLQKIAFSLPNCMGNHAIRAGSRTLTTKYLAFGQPAQPCPGHVMGHEPHETCLFRKVRVVSLSVALVIPIRSRSWSPWDLMELDPPIVNIC